jgi:hypothetical protein
MMCRFVLENKRFDKKTTENNAREAKKTFLKIGQTSILVVCQSEHPRLFILNNL